FARLNVTFDKPDEDVRTSAKKDPWNYWTFRLSANANINGQQLQTSKNYNFNASANRTTDNWKFAFNNFGNENLNSFTLDDGSLVKSSTRSWSSNTLLVKSVSAHWSLGGTFTVSRSSFNNEERVVKVAPGVEYDVFPYKESTKRSLTILYTVGASHYT